MKDNKNSRVSICVPVYNKEHFIKDALDSIVAQTYRNKEIIVSDNMSFDKTAEIVQGYIHKYGVKYCKTDQYFPNAEHNFNKCINLAKGDLVCIYHSDDVYMPDIVSKSVELLERYENVGAVFAMANTINEKGKTIGQLRLPKELEKLNRDFYNFDEIFSCLLKYGNSFLVCPSAMVRKSVYDDLGGWDYEKYKTAADLGLWLKIAQKYDIAIIDSPLMNYRISPMQGAYIRDRLHTERTDFFSVMDHYLESTATKNVIITNNMLRCYEFQKIWDNILRARNFLMQGKQTEARKLLHKLFFWDTFITGLKSLKRIGKLLIGIVLYIGVNVGCSRSLANILYKIQYELKKGP